MNPLGPPDHGDSKITNTNYETLRVLAEVNETNEKKILGSKDRMLARADKTKIGMYQS